MDRILPIYLDAHAGAPLLAEAAATMRTWLEPASGLYANHQSQLHRQGQLASQAVEKARRQIAELLGPGTQPDEIVLTSGATESIQIALQQAIFMLPFPGMKRPVRGEAGWPVILTWKAEHPATLDAADQLRQGGFAEVITLPCDSNAYYDPELLRQKLIELRTAGRSHLVVSALWASNEVGTIQDIAELARISHEYGALFHTDGTQAIAWLETRPNSLPGLTFLSGASHKLGGPAGAGFLWVRRRGPGTIPNGSSHEFHFQASWRPGTLPTSAIAGFGAAAAVFRFHRAQWTSDAIRQTQLLRSHILELTPPGLRGALQWQGPPEVFGPNQSGDQVLRRLPNNLSLGLQGIPGQEVYGHLAPFVATSAGSACRSATGRPSHVLTAMGISPEQAHATLRLGLSPRMADSDILQAAEKIAQAITRSAPPG